VTNVGPSPLVDGRYRVIDRLGSGGMADVFVAEDQQLGRRVALKLLYRRFAEDPAFVERFRREASAAAGLQHPNVVGVYDRGEWDGTYYIAMEYLEGRSLKKVIVDDGPLDPVWAIDVTVQILRAARFAHRRGIIHRDIKPHNVIVDDEGRAKVTDFGIARAGASDMTETGLIMGTAQYLSPEQAQGHAVSARSDLYSIGIVLYEMLTGRVPFDGETAVTIALKQVSAAPVPPSERADVPPDLEAVVLRALAKDPAERFADADEFAQELEQVRERIVSGAPAGDSTVGFAALAGPADGQPPALGPEDEEGERRAWPWVLAVALIVLVAGGALVYALTRPGSTTEVPNVTGIDLAAATATLQNRGFDVGVVRVVSDVRKDRVTRQSPQPGVKAKEGSKVTLTVSGGPGRATVPDVAGKTKADAKAQVKGAGFAVAFDQETSDQVPAGRATRTVPGEGNEADKGSKVTIFISTGPTEVSVPGVVGQGRDSAIAQIQGAGLQADVTTTQTTQSDPGTVTAQDPGPGARAVKGSTVTITVAQAPPSVDVPSVTGQSESRAKSTLRAAGLTPAVDTVDVQSQDQDGVVQDQSPPSGRGVTKGSTVTITIGKFTPPTTPTTPTTPTAPTTPETGGTPSEGK
jgi:beta-lactam-binding protein with PASTA domain